MVPFRPQKVFFKAFQNALNIAKQNNNNDDYDYDTAKISLIKIVSYPAGISIDEFMAADLALREYDLYKFDKILPELQKMAQDARIKLEVHVMDLRLSPAKALVEFQQRIMRT